MVSTLDDLQKFYERRAERQRIYEALPWHHRTVFLWRWRWGNVRGLWIMQRKKGWRVRLGTTLRQLRLPYQH